MKRWIFGLAAGGALLAAGAVAAEHGGMMPGGMMGGGMRPGGMMGMMGRFSPEDMDAFTDARIAALRTGLRLSPDQEGMWPPVEEALRGLVKLRRDQVRAWREGRGQARDDIPALLRAMADRQAARADALRRLADAAAPLYASLDEGQRRRLPMLARALRPRFGAMHHGMGPMHQMMDRQPSGDE